MSKKNIYNECEFTFYVLKGKIYELESSTGEGYEDDQILESKHNEITFLLGQIKEIKKAEKKAVYFCSAEGAFMVSGKFKGEVTLTMSKMDLPLTEFRKLDKKLKAKDIKDMIEETENSDESHIDSQGEIMYNVSINKLQEQIK